MGLPFFLTLTWGSRRKDLIELKAVGFSRFDIAALIEMKTVFRLYFLDGLGIGIDHDVQELSLAGGKLREVFSLAGEQGVEHRHEGLMHLPQGVVIQCKGLISAFEPKSTLKRKRFA